MWLFRTRARRGLRALSGRLAAAVAGLGSLALATVYFVLAWRIVFAMRLGPTAVTVSEGRGWGVHTGDAAALPVALLGLICLGLAVTWWERALRPRAPALTVVPAGWEQRGTSRAEGVVSAAA